MAIDLLSVDDKDKKFYIFDKTFFPTGISIDNACEMSFLIFCNIKINFKDQELKQKLYIIIKKYFIINSGKFVRRNQFVTAVLDPKNETFMIHIVSLDTFHKTEIHVFYMVKMTLLMIDEAFSTRIFRLCGQFLFLTHSRASRVHRDSPIMPSIWRKANSNIIKKFIVQSQ